LIRIDLKSFANRLPIIFGSIRAIQRSADLNDQSRQEETLESLQLRLQKEELEGKILEQALINKRRRMELESL
jgi:hypothetical protein